MVEEIRQGKFDFIVLNYANCDMVGHTGVFEAAVKAVEAVDAGLGQVLEAIKEMGGTAIVTADHGNAEQMVDPETGKPTPRTPAIWCPSGCSTHLKAGA